MILNVNKLLILTVSNYLSSLTQGFIDKYNVTKYFSQEMLTD